MKKHTAFKTSSLNFILSCLCFVCSDDEAVEAFQLLCKTEGIIPALESSHAIAYVCKLAAKMRPEQTIIVNLSGRGDKDMQTVMHHMEQSKQEKH